MNNLANNPISIIMTRISNTNNVQVKIIKTPDPQEVPLPPAKWLKQNNQNN
jgi:hypothetical protein